MGSNIGREFEMLRLGIIPVANDPLGTVASGTLWAPELDTFRISTVSGMRELRTGHGIIQVHRSADATGQTFTTTFTDVLWDVEDIKDSQYYTFSAESQHITIRHPGIYRVTYAQSVSVSAGNSRSTARSRFEIDGVGYEASISHGYHRIVNVGQDAHSNSFFVEITGHDVPCQVASARIAGSDTLQYIVGCGCSIERISPNRGD